MEQNERKMMTLETLLDGVNITKITGKTSCEILGIAYDSRRVTAGTLFVALDGEHVNGVQYIEEAIRRGAAAVLSQMPSVCGEKFPSIEVADARLALAQISKTFYDHPAERLCTVGITGTNGKTTVSFMLREIFKKAGRHPGLIGTVHYEIGERILPATRTTPEAPDIQLMLSQMEGTGCDSVIMEVSSHALAQQRIEGIFYDAAVFTNLTQDHLDYHGTIESYFSVKARLFGAVCRFAIINRDDPWGHRLLKEKMGNDDCFSYGFNAEADVRGYNVFSEASGSHMRVESPWGNVEISLQLIGEFNLHNALAAFATAAALGVPVEKIVEALADMKRVPGRLEAIANKKGKRIFVDYAHTDDALKNVLEALRTITSGRLIVVFGCGGNRDKTKRFLMGQVASRLADYSIITNDNPRSEVPENIAANIVVGFDSKHNYEVLLDRQTAIVRGLELIRKRDILLIAGKGHETFQEFQNTIVPFDDREVVREALCQK